MTWSIIAREPETDLMGIAVATRFFAVGALCPHVSAKGALATQALVNPTYGPRGLRLLAESVPPETIVTILTGLDEGRETRQLHVMDPSGRNAAWTGKDCIDWAGHLLAEHVSVAGNMLAGPAVIEATLATFQASAHLPLAQRLLAAMDAGEAKGGDKRGRQSAALMIQGAEPYPRLDIRVDDHGEPLLEMRRLLEVAAERFIPFSGAFPKSELDPGVWDRGEIDRMVERASANR